MTVLGAKLGNGYVFMSQQNSLAPTFVTTCLLSKFWEEHGLDQNAVHLVVHTYGDRQRIPGSCNILGEPFNPPRVRYLMEQDSKLYLTYVQGYSKSLQIYSIAVLL